MSATDAEWQAALAVVEALLDLAPEAREAHLAGLDLPEGVRARVRRMLAAEREASPLDAPLRLGDGLRPPEAGTVLGRWRLVAPIGRGGMSTVWRAQSTVEPTTQHAALKVMDAGAVDDAALRRFERELEILARLKHPGVAALLDAGRSEAGLPWFAMGLVDGAPIDVWCSERNPTLAARIDLLMQACEAVAHAHRHLVVHRDIKPGNVLVDAEGRVVLVDFGISRLLEETRDASTGTYAFTPRFAAPEQRSGGAISTATDVWGLGALAHLLLAGEPPNLPEGAEAVAPPASLPADLRAILRRALQRDPKARYSSVDALADDLRAFLEGRPVRAREGGALYRLGRTLRRHPAAAGLTVALAASLVLGVVASQLQSRRAEAEAERARVAQQAAEAATTRSEAALARATSLSDYLVQVFDGSNPNVGPQADAATLLQRGESLVEERLEAGEPQLAADLLLMLGRARLLRGEYAEADALFERGIALTAEDEAMAATRAALRFSRGEIARTQGRHADAATWYAEAEALARASDLGVEKSLEYGLARLTVLSAAGGSEQPLEAMQHWLSESEASDAVPSALRLRGLDVYSTMLALAGTPDTGPLQERRLALAAVVYADEPGWLAFSYADAVPSFRRWRAWDRARHYAAEALRVVDAHYDDPHVIPAIATCNAAGLALDLGRPEDAMALLDRTLAIDEALGRRHVHALSCLVHRAEARRALGDARAALAELDRADAMLAALALQDDRRWKESLCLQRVETLRQAGESTAAWARLDACEGTGGEPSPKRRLLEAERLLIGGDAEAAAAWIEPLPAASQPPPRDAPTGLEAWALALAVADARGAPDAASRRVALREAVAALPEPWAAKARWQICLATPPGGALGCLPGR